MSESAEDVTFKVRFCVCAFSGVPVFLCLSFFCVLFFCVCCFYAM